MSAEATVIQREKCVSDDMHECVRADESRDFSSVIVDTIRDIAQAFFYCLQRILSSISCYLGSKSWSIPGVIVRAPWALFKRTVGIPCDKTFKEEVFGSCYNHSFEKRLTPNEAKVFFPFACINAFMNRSDTSWIDPLGYKVCNPAEVCPFEMPLEKRESCFFDPNTGLKISVVEKGEDIVIAFGALRSPNIELQTEKEKKRVLYKAYQYTLGNLLGGFPPIYDLSTRFIDTLLQSPYLSGKKVAFAGKCYGGALASYHALRCQLPAFCVNSMPLGAGLQQKLGKEKLAQANTLIQHLTVEGDWMTDHKVITYCDRILSLLGLRAPGNFGRKYTIPSAYTSRRETHVYSLGSMMKHLGFHHRIKPQDLPHLEIQEILNGSSL